MSTGAPVLQGEAAGVGTTLRKSLGRLDVIFLAVAAVIGIDTIAQIGATGGAEAFTWAVVIAVTFLVPYALVTAELGSTFREEGGPYIWVRLAFGRLPAALSSMYYWVTNPIWLGGSLAFISAATWDTYVHPLPAGSVGDYVFKLVFVWLAIGTAVIGLEQGKRIIAAGAICKVALIAFLVVTVVVYAAKYGVQGYGAGDFSPTTAGFLAVTPILLFAFVGFEAPNGAAEEMRNPRRDVPVAVASSGAVAMVCYLVPIFAILAVVPAKKISGASGFLDSLREVFKVYGGAAEPMMHVAAVVFVFIVLTQGSAWMIASDRVQACAAADGTFPRYFGQFSRRFGTPVRMNMFSGVVATVFTLVATRLVSGSTAAVFTVVLTVAISTLLLSYLIIFPTAVRLRRTHPDAERPYQVPGGMLGMWVSTVLIYAWVVLGSWVAVFPGTLEPIVGITYDFKATWGVSRTTFEVFTVGTLLVIAALALLGYAWASRTAPVNAERGTAS